MNKIAVEQAVLGCILMYGPKALAEISLSPSDFQDKAHAEIFEVILALEAKTEVIDSVTVGDALADRKQLDRIGGNAYLSELAVNAPSQTAIKRYAEAVKDGARVRQLQQSAAKILEISHGWDSADEKIAAAQSVLLDLDKPEASQEAKSEVTAIREYIDWLERGKAEIQTKIFDEHTGGLDATWLTIIAAGTGQGKTTLALNLVRNLLGRKQMFFSFEMPASQLMGRIVSNLSGVPYAAMRDKTMSGEQWQSVTKAASAVKDHGNLKIVDNTLTIDQLCALARRTKNREGLDILYVDYLQLVPSQGESREREVAQVTRKLKQLALDLSIPVIALSQLSRKHEDRGNKRPRNSDLRESGAIEQDADLILFLFDEAAYDENSARRGLTELYSGKFRHGGHFSMFLSQQLDCFRFGNYTGQVPEAVRTGPVSLVGKGFNR